MNPYSDIDLFQQLDMLTARTRGADPVAYFESWWRWFLRGQLPRQSAGAGTQFREPGVLRFGRGRPSAVEDSG